MFRLTPTIACRASPHRRACTPKILEQFRHWAIRLRGPAAAQLALLAAARHTVLFHKPAGVVTTHADELERPTVDALRFRQRVRGRSAWATSTTALDQNTSGLSCSTDMGSSTT